jgi:hypothetical protein
LKIIIGKNFEVLEVEYEIKSQLKDFPQFFKGFIDIVIKAENGKIIIIDFKTAASLYFFNEFKDAKKDAQLVLYRNFYSKLENMSVDNIELNFIVLEKNINSKSPISLVKILCGNKKSTNAEEWMNNALKAINSNRFIKNFSSCFKYGMDKPCEFWSTTHCTRK